MAKHRGVYEKIKPMLDDLANTYRRPYEMRNRFIHDPWFVDQTGQLAQHKAQSGEGKEKPLYGMKDREKEDVMNIVSKIDALTERARSLQSLVEQL